MKRFLPITVTLALCFILCFSATFFFVRFNNGVQAARNTPEVQVMIAAAPSTNAAGDAHSCCTAPKANSATAFAALGNNAAFVATHENPRPFTFEGKGVDVTTKAADGTECFAYEVKPAKPTNNTIFVFQEFWGLNDYIKREADRLADETGAHVIALDLYDKKIATTREDAGKYMKESSPERLKTIIQAFQKYAGADAKIATIGWCFGGGWSHQASLLVGKQAVGCVIYYGMPEMDAAKLAAMNAPTLGIFAKQDKWITPEVAANFEKAVKATGKPIEIKIYDADHAFANPSNPKYQKEMAEDAHKAAVSFLKKSFS
jgi:carboxymethylenebutenolidase